MPQYVNLTGGLILSLFLKLHLNDESSHMHSYKTSKHFEEHIPSIHSATKFSAVSDQNISQQQRTSRHIQNN